MICVPTPFRFWAKRHSFYFIDPQGPGIRDHANSHTSRSESSSNTSSAGQADPYVAIWRKFSSSKASAGETAAGKAAIDKTAAAQARSGRIGSEQEAACRTAHTGPGRGFRSDGAFF